MSSYNPAKKYQIFISSTYKDLHEAREAVTKAILREYHIPIGMEMFSADNSSSWDVIRTTIEASDYYVLIVGHTYGSVDKTTGIGYTEQEFDYAVRIGIPVYIFIQKEDVPLVTGQREASAKKIKLISEFREKARLYGQVDFWSEKHELVFLRCKQHYTKHLQPHLEQDGYVVTKEALYKC